MSIQKNLDTLRAAIDELEQANVQYYEALDQIVAQSTTLEEAKWIAMNALDGLHGVQNAISGGLEGLKRTIANMRR